MELEFSRWRVAGVSGRGRAGCLVLGVRVRQGQPASRARSSTPTHLPPSKAAKLATPFWPEGALGALCSSPPPSFLSIPSSLTLSIEYACPSCAWATKQFAIPVLVCLPACRPPPREIPLTRLSDSLSADLLTVARHCLPIPTTTPPLLSVAQHAF
jgi:hypothetical protein